MNMPSKSGLLAARILMSAIFLIAGVRKLMTYAGTAGYFGSLGLPMPEVVVGLVALIEIGGALALITGWQVRPAALLLAAFTLASGFLGHKFWAADGAQFANQLNHFLKNVAMVGGFIAIALTATSDARSKD